MKNININGIEFILKVGSVIEFINLRNYKVVVKVGRIEEKSFYEASTREGGHQFRHSYGTLKDWAKMTGFNIYN